MNRIAILTDSTSDLPKALREQYQIDYVPMNYVVEEHEYPASLDWENHSPKAFYDLMRGGLRVRTTQVPREVFEAKFDAYLSQGTDVVYVSCSSALSGSVNLARLIAQELEKKHAHAHVFCVDSLISSLGQGYLAMRAARLRDEGKTAEQIVSELESVRLTVNQYATVESLDYLRRAGRVKASSAFFGNLFGVKPIILSDRIGQNYAFKKVKGAMAARQEIARLVAENVIDPQEQTLYISHADNLAGAEQLRDEILKLAGFRDVCMSIIAPIVGASVGPGTVSAYFIGKEVTIEGKE